ncbi:MAG: hypothetical protein AB7F22_10475 [Reyranella sp.]|uniref:hypothetical protein n=1 Tax=Reyranella sp. TaxID=1929291 RepID=UPI003D0E7935
MARKAKNDDGETTDEANGVGHNSGDMTEEQRKALTFSHKRLYEKALAAKKAADADLKNAAKRAKAELGDDAVALIKDMIALEGDDGEEKIKAAIDRQRRAAEYMGLPLGAQLTMFDEPDRTPAVDRARAEGQRDGMQGKSLVNPYAPELEQHAAYAEGWHDGQKAIFNLKPLEDAAEDDPRPRFLKEKDAELPPKPKKGRGRKTPEEAAAETAVAEKGIIAAAGEALGTQATAH